MGDSVLIFLDGIASPHLDTICKPIRAIDLQKGVLKYSLIIEIFEFKNSKWRGVSQGLFVQIAVTKNSSEIGSVHAQWRHHGISA